MLKKIIVLLALVLALGCVFTTCQLDTAARITVKFEDPGGGNKIPDAVIVKGESLGGKLPANLTREGPYIFYGWFDGASQYFSDTSIGADITLYARWSDDIAKVSFAFTQTNDKGEVIQPTATIPSVTAIKGIPLGPLSFPVAPRSKGWQFDTWLLNDEPFTTATPVPDDITLTARWVAKRAFTVKFNPGPGMTSLPDMEVYENECIDEWEKPGETRFPAVPATGSNPKDKRAFFVAWLDDENRIYDGRVPIRRNLTITGKWGLPPYIVNLRSVADGGDIEEVVSSELGVQGGNDYGTEPADGLGYKPVIQEAWDSTGANPKWVIVNERTYDVPFNPNRWRILYRVKLQIQDAVVDGIKIPFESGFYTKYTIRARFYANKQGAVSWPNDPNYDQGAFKPDKPAEVVGYSEKGWLQKLGYGEKNDDGSPKEISRSNDGWGQISWVGVANWDGAGASADTMLQRYNLDRKGGTINDDLIFAGSYANLAYPPYLLIQTSDNYIGHIEITEIVFHNGVIDDDPLLDEWKYTAYEGEEKPKAGAAE